MRYLLGRAMNRPVTSFGSFSPVSALHHGVVDIWEVESHLHCPRAIFDSDRRASTAREHSSHAQARSGRLRVFRSRDAACHGRRRGVDCDSSRPCNRTTIRAWRVPAPGASYPRKSRPGTSKVAGRGTAQSAGRSLSSATAGCSGPCTGEPR